MTALAHDITDKSLPENVSTLIEHILSENPMHRGFMQNALHEVTSEELSILDTYLDFCQSKGKTLPYMAESYLTIVGDTLREQIYFMKHKEYRHKTYADVAGHVYDDKYARSLR
ncbi:MAG: hypothetical protein AAF988_05095, partial [Pseudomonadota bacterium]